MRFDKLIARFCGGGSRPQARDPARQLASAAGCSRAAAGRARHRDHGAGMPDPGASLGGAGERGAAVPRRRAPRIANGAWLRVSCWCARSTARHPAEVEEVPDDLLDRLKLVETLGMLRIGGLTALLRRLKIAAREKQSENCRVPNADFKGIEKPETILLPIWRPFEIGIWHSALSDCCYPPKRRLPAIRNSVPGPPREGLGPARLAHAVPERRIRRAACGCIAPGPAHRAAPRASPSTPSAITHSVEGMRAPMTGFPHIHASR